MRDVEVLHSIFLSLGRPTIDSLSLSLFSLSSLLSLSLSLSNSKGIAGIWAWVNRGLCTLLPVCSFVKTAGAATKKGGTL